MLPLVETSTHPVLLGACAGKQVLRSTQAPHASSYLSCALSRICLLRIPLICPNPLTLIFPHLDLAAP